MQKLTRAALLCAASLVLSAAVAGATPITFHVTVNTASLVGNGAAPFAIDFQLNGGTPFGNSATITNFTFGGGAATTTPPVTTFGLASGSLTSAVTLQSNSLNAFNEFYQGFSPGSFFAFDLQLTRNVNSPQPDVFSFAILDGLLGNIPTTGGVTFGDALFVVNLDTPAAGAAGGQTFNGTGAFSGVTVTAVVTPEPVSLLLVGGALAGAGARRWRRQSGRSA
jgi:hypothetical protein